MRYITIEGGTPLRGEVAVQGAKNSVLPILAATLLSGDVCRIEGCPHLSDVDSAADILRYLGCAVQWDGDDLLVDSTTLTRCDIPQTLMRRMRSSVIFLGAILARCGQADLSYPGGCELGPRPIDLHLAALRALGAEIREEQGCLRCRGGKHLHGRELCLSIPSVGATENAMLAACGCPGITTIVGAAREPEIEDLQGFLRSMGAQVSGAGSSVVYVRGGLPLHPGRCRVMGDRIAAATYLCAAGAAGGRVEVAGVNPEHLTAVLACLQEAGCGVHTGPDWASVECEGPLCGISPVRTAPYPGFPTDAQAILMAALAGGRGTTMFVENMFDSRYRHVDELRRMGADIRASGRVAVVTGVGRLHGAPVRGTDLRGGAALVVAALGAEGETLVSGLSHVFRGYDGLDRALSALGADIQSVD